MSKLSLSCGQKTIMLRGKHQMRGMTVSDSQGCWPKKIMIESRSSGRVNCGLCLFVYGRRACNKGRVCAKVLC
jgi:hypothetical protein